MATGCCTGLSGRLCFQRCLSSEVPALDELLFLLGLQLDLGLLTAISHFIYNKSTIEQYSSSNQINL